MKFVVSSSELAQRLQTVGRVVTSKNNIQILSCFLIDIKDNVMRIVASDNENLMSTTLPVIESDGNFSFAVNAKTIVDTLKDIPEQPIAVYFNETTMELFVEYQNGKFSLMAEKAEEYPVFPALSEDAAVMNLSADFLLRAIARALPACSNDDLRPVMTGLYFDVQGRDITIVASDGHKLVCTSQTTESELGQAGFILPKKPSSLLKSLLGKESGDAKLSITERNAEIATETYTLTCRLIEGKYPNYKAVIPADSPNVVIVDRGSLLGALRRVLAVSADASSSVKIQLSSNEMLISSHNIDYGLSGEETVGCRYDGTAMRIGFKAAFFQEVINNLEFESIALKLTDPSRACIVTPETEEGNERALGLLMPMMLND